MSFAVLPVELLHAVCLHASNSDLTSLARTNSVLNDVAQRVLCRHLSLSSQDRTLPVVVTLAKNSTLAHFVRSLTVVVDPRSPVLHAFYTALARVISSMPELTTLSLHLPPSASWILDHVHPLASHPRLRTFTSTFPFDLHVASFLTRTPSLRELELDSSPITSTLLPILPPDALPSLAHFMGSCQAARILIPGRPLESVHLHDGDLTEDAIHWLAQSTGRLAILGAVTSAQLVPFLRSLARRLPHLAHLRLLAPFQDDARVSTNSFYDDVAAALDAMPDLVDFELSGVHWASSYQSCERGPKRVWHSAPCTPSVEAGEDVFDFYSDMFLVY